MTAPVRTGAASRSDPGDLLVTFFVFVTLSKVPSFEGNKYEGNYYYPFNLLGNP